MKNRIILILLILIVLGIIVFFVTQRHINYLSSQISIKDERIEAMKDGDSTLAEATKEYSNTITKYINDCTVLVDDKSYNLNQFIDLFVSEAQQKEELKDSLFKLKFLYDATVKKYGNSVYIKETDSTIRVVNKLTKTDTALAYLNDYNKIKSNLNSASDSLSAYKYMIEYLEDRLDIKAKYKLIGNKYDFNYSGLKTIDSALILLPYYRHRLKIEGKTITVEVDNEYLKNERREKRQEKRGIN